jgi:hypothetical protein
VLAEDGRVKLMVPRLPDDLPGETLVMVAKHRPDGVSGMMLGAVIARGSDFGTAAVT